MFDMLFNYFCIKKNMREFDDFDEKYPELIVDLLEHFMVNEGKEETVANFCHHSKYAQIGKPSISPQVIVKICDILCQQNILSVNRRAGVLGLDNSYLYKCIDKDEWKRGRHMRMHYYNSLVYGFTYVYKFYQNKVIPIVSYKTNGEPMMGTAFKFHQGLLTARHCLTDGTQIAIKGYSAEMLNKTIVLTSQNPYLDIAYIHTGEDAQVFRDTPNVLDDILVMGFPKIPSFLNFCTAEKGCISAMADLRMTPTRGSIAALADEIWTQNKTKLMLITAKICGGNSGGPIINKGGCVVGLAFGAPIGEGDTYDNLGYGVGVPLNVLDNIFTERHVLKIQFTDLLE